MNTERFTFAGCGGTKLSAAVWTPDGQPKMVLQIAHGMTEHIGRYDKLAEVFNQDNKDWIKNTKWLLALLINEGAEEGEPEVTEKQVGRWIHTGNIVEVQSAILKAFAVGTSGDNVAQEEEPGGSNDGTDEGNAESGQVS